MSNDLAARVVAGVVMSTVGRTHRAQALARRFVDRPLATDLAPENLSAVGTAPLGRFADWLARGADRGFDARPAVRASVVIAVLL
jgi:hypothetical protein